MFWDTTSVMIHSFRETAAILIMFNLLIFCELCSLEIRLLEGLFALGSEQQFESGDCSFFFFFFLKIFLEGNNKERRTFTESQLLNCLVPRAKPK